MSTGLITTLLIYYVVSYLKTFSDQKDPLETHMLPLINSWTLKPWQKTAARKFLPLSQNLKWDLCCETIQISSLCSQGNYKTCSQIIWSEHSQLWSRHTDEGWASFPLSMGWTQTQVFPGLLHSIGAFLCQNWDCRKGLFLEFRGSGGKIS